MSGSWGSGLWGGGPWGGGASGTIALLSALAIRENVIQLGFSNPIYLSNLLDPADASRIDRYTIDVVSGTIGLNGEGVRPVRVISAALATVNNIINPHLLDLSLDRPMTPYPAAYTVTARDIFLSDLSSFTTASMQVVAVFKRIEPPQLNLARPTRDIANPQTYLAMLDQLPDPQNALNLGTITIDDTGDYAFDEGLVSLKKRVIRRLITRKNAFAHLPGYGVGVPSQGKRLATASVQTELAADAEAQISREPDVRRVRVTVYSDQAIPGLVRFQIAVIPKTGPPQRFDVPFNTR